MTSISNYRDYGFFMIDCKNYVPRSLRASCGHKNTLRNYFPRDPRVPRG